MKEEMDLDQSSQQNIDPAASVSATNWKALIKPSGYTVEKTGEHTSVFSVEPLEKGFGVTMGNALRRVLLSSLQGAAITGIKVEGADHEFSSVPGMREDITKFILKLKKIAIDYDGSDPIKLHLKAKGPCEVTAGMITESHNATIVNKDLVLCTLGKNSALDVELRVCKGKGYVVANDNEFEQMPLGYIPIDSIFSPVQRVSYSVQDNRIGSKTEYDKLMLTVQTDGSLTPEIAVAISSRIIQEQLKMFINFKETEDSAKEEEKTLPFNPALLKKVGDLELSVRSQNCLRNENISYMGDLVIKTEAEMLKTPNFGRKSLNEIKDLMHSMNLKFGMEVPGWPPENIEELVAEYEDQIS